MLTPDTLRGFRKRHGLGQVPAAAMVGVSVGSWRDWEQGRHLPPAMLAILMDTLDQLYGPDTILRLDTR